MLRKAAPGRFLPVGILSPDRPLLGESRHSSKEFICSVRPSSNDRSRLGAAGQHFRNLPLRQAGIGQEETLSQIAEPMDFVPAER